LRYIFRRASQTRSIEINLDADRGRFELVITADRSAPSVERFGAVNDLIAREHRLIAEWSAEGWRMEALPNNRVH
jgi:hypothetical protein